METFLAKSQLCDMIEFSVAKDKELFDGNTILPRKSENNKHRYVYIGGDMVCTFLANDRFYKYISNMRNNLPHYSIAIGAKNLSHLTPYFKFFEKKRY